MTIKMRTYNIKNSLKATKFEFTECPNCFGRGKIVGVFPIDKRKCEYCNGVGVIEEEV